MQYVLMKLYIVESISPDVDLLTHGFADIYRKIKGKTRKMGEIESARPRALQVKSICDSILFRTSRVSGRLQQSPTGNEIFSNQRYTRYVPITEVL